MTTSAGRGRLARRHGARQPGRPVLRAGALLVSGALGFVVVGYLVLAAFLESGFDARDNSELISELESVGGPGDADAGRDLTLLLMGSDTREGDNGDHNGDIAGMRNDTTLLVHISEDRTRVEAVSIPRDLQVPIADCRLFDGTQIRGGYGDFNTAFSNGGRQGDAAEAAACTINTVQDLTGIPIDHWAVIDFTGFEDMVDAIGGIPMCITQDISSEDAHLHLEAGPQVLDGEQALGYARLRTAEEGGVSGSDLQRITRQQELLRQTIRTVFGKSLLTDADEITQFLRATAGAMTMDERFGDLEYLEGLAWSLRDLSIDDVVFATVPWEYTEDRLNVVATEDAETMWEQLRNDQPLTVDAEGDATSEWDTGRADAPSAEPSSTAPSTPRPSSPTPTPTPEATDAEAVVDDLLAECGP